MNKRLDLFSHTWYNKRVEKERGKQMNGLSQIIIALSLMVLIGAGIKIAVAEIKSLFSKN